MNGPQFHKLFADHYVLTKLDVMENGEKKAALENPGGDKVMSDLGGAKSGLPFFAILDAQGKKLADSNALPGGKNIGHPAAPEEVDAFETILKRTAPKMPAAQRDKLVAHLRETGQRH